MKKTYIAPASVEHKVMLTSLIAESFGKYDDDLDGQNALGNEDFGWGDDDDPASWNWKNN